MWGGATRFLVGLVEVSYDVAAVPEDERIGSSFERLVVQRLMERTSRLADRDLLAFTEGWSSLLELLERSDLWATGEDAGYRVFSQLFVARIRAAQRTILDDAS